MLSSSLGYGSRPAARVPPFLGSHRQARRHAWIEIFEADRDSAGSFLVQGCLEGIRRIADCQKPGVDDISIPERVANTRRKLLVLRIPGTDGQIVEEEDRRCLR